MMSLKGDICNVVISGTQLWPICCSNLLFFSCKGQTIRRGWLKGNMGGAKKI